MLVMVPQLVRKSAARAQRQNKRRESFCIVTHWKSALCVFCQYRSAVLRSQNPRLSLFRFLLILFSEGGASARPACRPRSARTIEHAEACPSESGDALGYK